MPTADAHLPPLFRTLQQARRDGRLVADLNAAEVPADADAACRIQDALLDGAAPAGWKVGGGAGGAAAQAAPLPGSGVMADPGHWPLRLAPLFGLELELAFQFSRRFEPRAEPYDEREVLGAIGTVRATIEVVRSRFAAWPGVDRLAQLADLQNHEALVLGEPVPYDSALDCLSPQVVWTFDGEDVSPIKAANPAGDPRGLLTWLVNHCSARGYPIEPGTVVTTGTYTGLFRPAGPGTAAGRIEGLPAVHLTLAPANPA